MIRSIITGSGSYIPSFSKKNADFTGQAFYTDEGIPIEGKPELMIEKFKKITGIEERRYVPEDWMASDMAAAAATSAIADSGIEPSSLDLIIVAHNFGDVAHTSVQSTLIPSLASKVKHQLGIQSPGCVAWDVLFGCPGWILGMINAEAFFRAGMASKALVIGTETLSRVIDVYDRDSMLFGDGAGAVVLEFKEGGDRGILSSSGASYCMAELDYLLMGQSNRDKDDLLYMKMKGRKVYEFALTNVPQAMKDCLDKSGCSISELKKIFIHQANEKMDEAIVAAFYELYGAKAPVDIMPMNIRYLGNSSVATIPTLFDSVRKGNDAEHSLSEGDVILFASVGAGMNVNAVCYRY